jgi:hypothetical protein
VLELRKTLPTFGSRRLIREFDLRIATTRSIASVT